MNRIEDKIRQAYSYIQLIREHFESHSWCRRQTQYDSEFIADFNHRLMNMSNKIYELTQQLFPQPLDDTELKKESEARREIIRRLTAKCEQLQEKIQTTNVYYLREIQSNKVECESKIEVAIRQESERIMAQVGAMDKRYTAGFVLQALKGDK